MIVCMPTETDAGLDAKVFNHFGNAPFFTIYNTETKDLEVIANGNMHHAHGTCQPTAAISGKNVDVIICGGMGSRAVSMLNAQNIKVYQAKTGTVKETIEKLSIQELTELTPANACKLHSCS